jgi:hypothetical protein
LDFFFSIFHPLTPNTTVAMAPPKKAPAAKENVSLGPLAGDGMLDRFFFFLFFVI